MKTKLWLLLAGVSLILLIPHKTEATGACTAARFHDWKDNGCNQPYSGAGGPSTKCPTCPPCCGMPRWWVSEPYENLWIKDTPLSYKTSSGQEIGFKFYYRQRYKFPDPDEVPDFYPAGWGTRTVNDYYMTQARAYGLTNAAWGNNWMRDIVFWDSEWEYKKQQQLPPGTVFSAGYEALMFRPEGGIYYFYTNSSGGSSLQDPRTQVKLEPLSAVGYPTVNTPQPDANGIYWGGSQTNGFRLVYPDGSQDIFGLCYFPMGSFWQTYSYTTAHAFLTERIDPQGRVTRIGYEYTAYTNYWAYQYPTYNAEYYGFRVKYVVDPDGRTNTFVYYTNTLSTPTYSLWQLAKVVDPYGRKASFSYNTNGQLSGITDAAGMASSFEYHTFDNTNTWISSLITPYGTNQFGYYDVPDSSGTVIDGYQERAVFVQEPEGAQQLFCYIHDEPLLPASVTNAPVVSGQTFDDGNSGTVEQTLYRRNTYHWGPRQCAALSLPPNITPGNFGPVISGFTLADFYKADIKHWLLNSSDLVSITASMSSEQEPSPDPDGSTPGLRTWYTYVGQPAGQPQELGDDPQISCVARQLPDDTNQYTIYNYYPAYESAANRVSSRETTYSKPDGSIGLLTTYYEYADNGIDLTNIHNSAGQSLGLSYNSRHQVTNIVNALGQVTTLGWEDSSYNYPDNTYYYSLTNISFPSGENVSLAYNFSSGYLTNYPTRHWVPGPDFARLQTISWSPSGRSFTIDNWTNALPWIVTDDRGLTVTNTWDGLNRLTSTTFPDGTDISNIYDRLDLGATKDRMGNWTHYAHDGLQHLTGITNANHAVTVLGWCGCGSLESILDAAGTTPTTLGYDNQGNLTSVNFPDNTSLNYYYDLAGRMTNVMDGAGRFLKLAYNNQGLVTNVVDDYGTLESIAYDAVNRPISVTDANGVTVTNDYDAINELLSRTWLADDISEGFGYSTNGLVAYTNRDQRATYFLRDGAERILAITNANQEVVQFSYDSLNNVTNMIDGLQHTTKWQYNLYGWLTNKIDGLNRDAFQFGYNADGWVTNRVTPQMGNTFYAYDAVGNLTNITYPASSILYSYDADNRLTNMVDASGTNSFTYTPVGQLASETGPWPDDTVSYLYRQMLRTNLTITEPGGSWVQDYSYDNGWRLQSLTSPAGSFGYTFNGGASPLVAGISLPNGANIRNVYDSLARLRRTVLRNPSGYPVDGYIYTLDALGLRTNIVRNFGLMRSSVAVGYDNIGQITSWLADESSGTPRLNEQLGFGYDAADNLHLRTNNALVQTFTVDAANELTDVSRTGTLTVSGNTPEPTSSLTVNGQQAQTNADFTFASPGHSLNNGLNTFTNVARNMYGVLVTNVTSSYLPTSISLLYDQNGNLTNDGTHNYAYNAENELTNVSVAGQWQMAFVYDGLGRRRIEIDSAWQNNQWVVTNEIRYIYDGYLPIQERDTNNNVLVTYTRGLDLSGTLQDAGGIGGLLARTDANGSTYYHADGSGNVTALMDGNGYIVARYMYNPFGKLLGEWESMADANEMRFSSMIQRDNLSLYPFRAYHANLQRWLNEDPIQERGGINLYQFGNNNPISYIDPFGLLTCAQLKAAINQLDNIIDNALHSMSDINQEFANAQWHNYYSAGETFAGAAYSIASLSRSLVENAAKNATYAIQVSRGTLPVGVIGANTTGGSVVLSGSGIAGPVSAANVGAGVIGAKDAGDEIAKEAVTKASHDVQRVLDPYGRLSDVENQTGNEMSTSTYQTIKNLQHKVGYMLNKYNKNCCKK